MTCAEKTVGITQLGCVKVNSSILSENYVKNLKRSCEGNYSILVKPQWLPLNHKRKS